MHYNLIGAECQKRSGTVSAVGNNHVKGVRKLAEQRHKPPRDSSAAAVAAQKDVQFRNWLVLQFSKMFKDNANLIFRHLSRNTRPKTCQKTNHPRVTGLFDLLD